ncbi:MAG: hypothetical protein ABSE39_02400 [Candidatus Bathyarchaeia archaeon]
MKVARNVIVCLVLALVTLTPALTPVMAAIAPLAAATFPVGTIVVPMDGKQNDRIHVYGLIHEFQKSTPNALLARVIEPPDVTLQTQLTPSGDVYQGGPFLIDASYDSNMNTMLSNSTFAKVTVTHLTSSFTSNNIFFVRQPTRILVIGDGYWGKTFLTLQRMGISYTQVTTDQILANPSLINQFSLIVLDSPGWYGNPIPYAPARRAQIQAVYNTIQTRVQAGNEVMFTDAALLDLNSTFPGYIHLGASGIASTPNVIIYNPPRGGFNPEFPSQYYNAGPNPNNAKILTEEGAGQWVPTGVQSAHAGDIRILMDSKNYGYPHPQVPYTILAFYFPYGYGIVEGLAFQPYQQLYPNYADVNGYYATYEIYGNKFVEGPQIDFLLSASPSTLSVAQGQTATYTLSVTSIQSFSSAVNLQVTGGLPPGAQASIVPSSVTPAPGGTISSTLTIPIPLSTPTGTYTLTITGTSSLPQISHSITVTLSITPTTPDFTIAVTPNAVVNQGQCGNITVTVGSIGNFSSPVDLTLSSLPAHVSGSFTPNPVTPPIGGTALSYLQLCADTSLAPGNYTITVAGTSGGVVHTADITLDVPIPVFNLLLLLILLALLFLAIALGLIIFALSRRGPKRSRVVPVPVRYARMRPRAQYVMPLPTVRCRNCGRMMPLQAIFCPFCGRPQVTLAPRPGRVAAMSRRTTRSVTGFSLILVSGILVLLNSAALLAPSFYGPPLNWSAIFFWLPTIGQNYAFVIGAIIGLTLIMGSIIMVMGHGAIADVIIFPFAVFSLIIGGGFVAGFVLGVVGGILGALKR